MKQRIVFRVKKKGKFLGKLFYMTCVVDSLLLLLLLHFTPTVVASLKIPKRLILKKIASAFNLFHQSASASTKN